MMDLELLGVLADPKVAYPDAELDGLWHGILINQFHDILPGSSIHEVYEVTKKEYEEMEAQISVLTDERVRALIREGEGVTVLNTTGFERDDVVELGDCDAEALLDENGSVYPVQQTRKGAVAFVKDLPSKGYKTSGRSPPGRRSGPSACLLTAMHWKRRSIRSSLTRTAASARFTIRKTTGTF